MFAETGIQTAVFNAIRPGICLTLDQLAEALPDHRRRPLINATRRLIERGWVERVERGCYQLTAAGGDAQAAGLEIKSGPRGGFERKTPVRNSLNTRLWRAMRLKGKFTIPALLELAAKDEKNPYQGAARFVRLLEKAGYLLRLPRREKGTAPTSPGYIRYTLVRDTGDLPPMLRRGNKAIFDPNTGEEVSWTG